MKGHQTERMKEILEKRGYLLNKIEVLNIEIKNLNQQLIKELVNSYTNKNIQFDEGNKVSYVTEKELVGIGVPSDRIYRIFQIKSSNSHEDIAYYLEDKDGPNIMVKQEFFHSFKFIDGRYNPNI